MQTFYQQSNNTNNSIISNAPKSQISVPNETSFLRSKLNSALDPTNTTDSDLLQPLKFSLEQVQFDQEQTQDHAVLSKPKGQISKFSN